MTRIRDAYRWYLALRRDRLLTSGFRLTRRHALGVAWRWSGMPDDRATSLGKRGRRAKEKG